MFVFYHLRVKWTCRKLHFVIFILSTFFALCGKFTDKSRFQSLLQNKKQFRAKMTKCIIRISLQKCTFLSGLSSGLIFFFFSQRCSCTVFRCQTNTSQTLKEPQKHHQRSLLSLNFMKLCREKQSWLPMSSKPDSGSWFSQLYVIKSSKLLPKCGKLDTKHTVWCVL